MSTHTRSSQSFDNRNPSHQIHTTLTIQALQSTTESYTSLSTHNRPPNTPEKSHSPHSNFTEYFRPLPSTVEPKIGQKNHKTHIQTSQNTVDPYQVLSNKKTGGIQHKWRCPVVTYLPAEPTQVRLGLVPSLGSAGACSLQTDLSF